MILVALGAFAWSQRFVLDDAFISFRYARNLVAGDGLVWNPGEPVEGYTNFLWTMVVAAAFWLGVDPVTFCYVLGPLLAMATLFIASRIGLLLVPSRLMVLAAVVLIGANPTFAAFATSGLETMLLTCLVTALLWAVLVASERGAAGVRLAATISLLAAAALMTRLDAAVIVGPLFVAAAVPIVRRSGPPGVRSASGRPLAVLAALCAPAAVILAVWLAWKLAYYGEILPNTYHAKVGDTLGLLAKGLGYLRIFFTSYVLWPFLILVVIGMVRAGRKAPGIVLLAVVCLCHLAYVALVGGDFMEFRFLVPILAPLLIAIVWSMGELVRRPVWRVLLVIALAAGFIHHSARFGFTHGIEPVEGLAGHLDHPASDWVGIGKKLEMFSGEVEPVRIAVTPAGAIPFYSKLPAVDMLGLNDRWIARNGLEFSPQPGHNRVAPLGYMVERQVHLVLAHPWLRPPSKPERTFYTYGDLKYFRFLVDAIELPGLASIVEIPLQGGRRVVVLYLTPHPAVDRAIAAERWRRFPVQ